MAGSGTAPADGTAGDACSVGEVIESGPQPGVLTITTEGLPEPQRVDAWNAAFGSLNEITVPREGERATAMRSVNWRLSGMVLSTTRVPSSRFQRDAMRARRDSYDHWMLRVLRQGRSHVRHPAFSCWVGPRQPLLFSMHETWSTDWVSAEWVTLCIPRDLNPDLSAFLSTLRAGPLVGACTGLLADLMLALPGRVAEAAPEELPALAEATRAAVTACLMAGRPQPAEGSATIADLEKERVRKAIHRQIGSARLTPARLASAAGLSRSALYRLFADEGGVARYVRDVRLSVAHAALRDPAKRGFSISQVAEAHGFPDPSAFSRAFRQAFGLTPGEVRAAGWPGPAPPRPWSAISAADTADDIVARIYRTGAPPADPPALIDTAGRPLPGPHHRAVPGPAAAAP